MDDGGYSNPFYWTEGGFGIYIGYPRYWNSPDLFGVVLLEMKIFQLEVLHGMKLLHTANGYRKKLEKYTAYQQKPNIIKHLQINII